MAIYNIDYINESAKIINKLKIKIYGRDFNLKIQYDNYKGEDISNTQISAVNDFLSADIDSSLDRLKKYIISHNDSNVNSVDNVFKYISPKYLYVPKSKNRIVAIMCNYKFDNDNGICIVFKNNKFSNIDTQDYIL